VERFRRSPSPATIYPQTRLAELGPGGAPAAAGIRPGSGGAESADGPRRPDCRRRGQGIAGTGRLGVRRAQIMGDLLTLAADVADLPPDVVRSWDRIRQLGLQTLAGAALSADGLPLLARALLDELEERRRLILTSVTSRRTGVTTTASQPSSTLAASAYASSRPRGCRNWPGSRARPLPLAALAGSIGRTAWRRRHRRCPRRSAVAGRDAVLAGRSSA
jgi:hypothetical protein